MEVYGYTVALDGAPMIVSEFLPIGSLAGLRGQLSLTMTDRIALLSQAASAVAAAHRQGLFFYF
jgi:hypothetical protein